MFKRFRLLVVAFGLGALGFLLVASPAMIFPGQIFLAASCLILVLIACAARNSSDLLSAVFAVVAGIATGAPVIWVECLGPVGMVVGPLVGLVVRIASRPPGDEWGLDQKPAMVSADCTNDDWNREP